MRPGFLESNRDLLKENISVFGKHVTKEERVLRTSYFFTAKLYDIFVEPFNVGLRQIGMGLCVPERHARVLEIGCGTGTNLALFQKAGCVVFGVELSPFMLKMARKKLGDSAFLQLADAGALPYPDDFFDMAIAMLTFHEMAPGVRRQALGELIRTVKPGGCLLLTDFCAAPLQFPKGWLYKVLNFIFEIAGGYRHFKNYRNFMRSGALRALVQTNAHLVIEEEKILSGGNLAVMRVRIK